MLAQVKPRLIIVVAALVVVSGLVGWGLHTPAGSKPKPQKFQQISYPKPLPNPLTLLHVPTLGKGWKSVFSQGFPGKKLNTKIWGTCYPWQTDPAKGCTNFGNSNEYEWYLPSQDIVSDGVLHLTAKREITHGFTSTGAPRTYYCRSGMVTSYPSFKFEYGYVRVVAWVPPGAGLWSAIWLAAANLKWPPEIDLVEHWGEPYPLTGVYYHPLHAHGQKVHLSPAENSLLQSGWHTYSLSWTKTRVTWFIDGKAVMTAAYASPHQKMYLIMNLADYKHPKSTCFGEVRVKSVKIWQQTTK
jgi:beta-glucanase (GH16 family)